MPAAEATKKAPDSRDLERGAARTADRQGGLASCTGLHPLRSEIVWRCSGPVGEPGAAHPPAAAPNDLTITKTIGEVQTGWTPQSVPETAPRRSGPRLWIRRFRLLLTSVFVLTAGGVLPSSGSPKKYADLPRRLEELGWVCFRQVLGLRLKELARWRAVRGGLGSLRFGLPRLSEQRTNSFPPLREPHHIPTCIQV